MLIAALSFGNSRVPTYVSFHLAVQKLKKEADVPNDFDMPSLPIASDCVAQAAAAVAQLVAADVVLTTYSVLQQEVHYSPHSQVLRSLRHEKRYKIVESPLLQVTPCCHC